MEKIVVDFEVNTNKTTKNLKEVNKEVEELNKNLTETTDDASKGLTGVKSASDNASKGFKGMGLALKSIGIGLIISAFASLVEVFKNNQKVADTFSVVFEAFSLVVNDFVNFVIDNSGGVIKFFKGLFTDPLASMKKFAKAFKENIQERFESYLDTLGFLASAVKKVFSGDFAGALEDVKSAGKESLDVLTGVNDVFDKGKKIVLDGAKAISDYTKEVVKSAKENVKLAKSSELAAAQQSLLIEKYDIQAEKLRQIRDEERNSIADRIKANNDLKEVLENQEKAMLKQADLQIASARANVQKNNSIENQVALIDALANREGVLAQIQGFRSEQLANDLALDREKIELTKSKEESEAKLSIERKRFNAEQIEDELLRLEALKVIDEEEKIIQEARLQALIDEAKDGTQAKIDAQIELDTFLEEARQLQIEREKEIDEAELKRKGENTKKELELDKKKVAGKKSVVDSLSQFADAETGIGKALLIAKQGLALQESIMDLKRITFKGTQAVAEAGVSTAQNVAESSKIGFPQNIITIAGAIAQGIGIIGSVKKAVSKTRAGSVAGASSVSVPSVSSPSLPPAFNVVGQSSTSQLADAIGGQSQQPIKAFVVSGDVTTAQSLDRNIIDGASI